MSESNNTIRCRNQKCSFFFCKAVPASLSDKEAVIKVQTRCPCCKRRDWHTITLKLEAVK